MRKLGWSILLLSFSYFASAQEAKDCSAPPGYTHTTLHKRYSGKQSFASGMKVYYNCAEDFTPSSGIPVVQCFDGKWTKLTLKCEKRSCGYAGDILNGQVEYEGNSYLGEKVYMTCNEGYTLKGLSYRICKRSGWTGELPSCEASSTREATCSAPVVANSVSSGGDVYQVGDTMTFTCSQGFKLDGAQQITCGPDGQWLTQPPQCLPSPGTTRSPSTTRSPDTTPPRNEETGGCGVPVTARNSNANLADKYITLTSFASGDRVHYVCDVGYIQAGGSRYRQCKQGQWTKLLLKCERKPCGSAGEMINGQFIYTGVEFGDTATAVCDEGYHLVGRETRNCMSQGWDGRIPVCEAVVCEQPPEVTNAEMDNRQEPPYTYRSVLRYQCRVGTLKGPKEIWCTENGTWSAAPPKCEEKTCPSPNVPGAFWTEAWKRSHQYRDTISIECKPGYTMAGPSVVTCGSDGYWAPGLPRCQRTARRTYRRG